MSLVEIIEKFMPKTYSAILSRGAKFMSLEQEGKRRKFDQVVFDVNHEIGKPIIAVPNEHQDMIIGIIVGHDTISQAQRPVAIVHCYVRNKEIMLLPKAYSYNEGFARTISNLEPCDRHLLFYGHEKKFSVVDEDTLIGWGKMYSRLKKNGFFDRLERLDEGKNGDVAMAG